MLSSQKVFYIILISMLVVCSLTGVGYQGSAVSYDVIDVPTSLEQTVTGQLGIVSDGDAMSFDTILPPAGRIEVSITGQYVHENGDSQSERLQNESTTTTTVMTQGTALQPGSSVTNPNSPVIPNTPSVTNVAPSPNNPSVISNPSISQNTNVNPDISSPTITTTTTTTTTRVTTTTTTTAPTTVTTAPTNYDNNVYTNTGAMGFVYPGSNNIISEIRVCIEETSEVTLNLFVPLASSSVVKYSSKNAAVATVKDVGSGSPAARVTVRMLGSTWIQAYNPATRETAYCKVTVTDFSGQVLYLVNLERAKENLPPYALGDSSLQAVADLRLSESMEKFEHTRPNNTKFSTAFDACGIRYGTFGENLARGQVTPKEVVDAWMNSPTHRANIMSNKYTMLCVSHAIKANDTYAHYWVQSFYKPYN